MTHGELDAIVSRAEAILERLEPLAIGWQSYGIVPGASGLFFVTSKPAIWRYYGSNSVDRLCVVTNGHDNRECILGRDRATWLPMDCHNAAVALISALGAFARMGAKYENGRAFAAATAQNTQTAMSKIEKLFVAQTPETK